LLAEIKGSVCCVSICKRIQDKMEKDKLEVLGEPKKKKTITAGTNAIFVLKTIFK